VDAEDGMTDDVFLCTCSSLCDFTRIPGVPDIGTVKWFITLDNLSEI
jgi:hypothetical protein